MFYAVELKGKITGDEWMKTLDTLGVRPLEGPRVSWAEPYITIDSATELPRLVEKMKNIFGERARRVIRTNDDAAFERARGLPEVSITHEAPNEDIISFSFSPHQSMADVRRLLVNDPSFTICGALSEYGWMNPETGETLVEYACEYEMDIKTGKVKGIVFRRHETGL